MSQETCFVAQCTSCGKMLGTYASHEELISKISVNDKSPKYGAKFSIDFNQLFWN